MLGSPSTLSPKTQKRKTLPKKLRGAVCVQYVRCGKRCGCQNSKGHGPYYYRFWREDGRSRKEYVRRKDLETVRAACAEYRREGKETQEAMRLFRRMTARLRGLGL